MYHCNLQFYLIGQMGNGAEIIKATSPLEHFSHSFIEHGQPQDAALAQSDVIFANLQGFDGRKLLEQILLHKKETAEVILLAEGEQKAELTAFDPAQITDIWTLPLTGDELRFRFLRWQQAYKLKKDLWLAQTYLDTTINSVPHLIWYKDKVGAHLKVNQSFCRAVNKTREQIEGRGHYYIWGITPDEYAKGEYICMESEYEVMEKRQTCVFDENVKIKDDMRKLKTYKSPLFDLDGSVMGTVGVATDVTQERLYEQMIINNANTDFLTSLYNRRYVYEYVEKNKNLPITIYYLDLDNFKSVNDKFGHQEGDRALLIAAEVLQNCMPEDMAARIGGDEFMVIRIGAQTAQEIEEKRLLLQQKLDEAFAKHEHFKGISASIGTAYSEDKNINVDALAGEADTFMYREKYRKKQAH
ncbi:MAG: sensor domain-containing diguanylate cyclase [Clostridiales bacterium]|nr:sensor domain-containing diguanylate cyclase [Clostridiales bacterium]